MRGEERRGEGKERAWLAPFIAYSILAACSIGSTIWTKIVFPAPCPPKGFTITNSFLGRPVKIHKATGCVICRPSSNPHQGYKYEGSNRFWEPRRPFLIMLQTNDRQRDKDKDRERELPASSRNTWMLSNHSCWEASLAKLKRKSFRLRFRVKPPHMVLFEDMQKVYKMMLNSPLLIPITSSCTTKHPCLVVPCHCSAPEYLSVAVTWAPSSCNSSSTSDSISLLLLSSSYPSPFSFFLSSILSDLSLCLLLLLIFFAHKDQHRSRKLVVTTTSHRTKLFLCLY